MAVDLLKNVTDLLNEEKWTRATLNSYSISNFKELDVVIEAARAEGLQEEVKALCDEHIRHTSNSIIALYVSGILALSRELVDDSSLIMLINLFTDNHKWNIVEYLCGRILEFGENKFALRTLGDCYANRSEEDRKLEIWDRLIRVDFEEADIVKALGEKREEAGEKEAAVDYFKKAIHRYINKKQFANVKELWDKLVELAPDDTEFFFHIEKRISKNINEERAATLLTTLVPVFHDKGDWNTSIEILKRILAYDPKNHGARKDITECYRNKYADHSQLEEYVKISNLTQNWRSVHEAVADFEKHISFDTGNYVFHRTWGIGRISSIKDDTFTIDFLNKSSHKMSLKMAISALEVLSADHIWVVKKIMDKDALKAKVKEDPAWALRTVIKSFGNMADMKRIKAELTPDVLTAGEWSRWNTEARALLKKDSAFGNIPDKIDLFTVREKPISFEEKTFNKFKAEKNFFDRARTVADFVLARQSEPDSEYFSEMLSYFTGFLKASVAVSETVIGSWLLVQKITTAYPFLSTGSNVGFEDLFSRIEDVEGTFSRIEDPDLRKDFLVAVRRYVAQWPDVFTRLFYVFPCRLIVDELVNGREWDKLTALLTQVHGRFKDNREAFIWMARNLTKESWFSRTNIPLEKIHISLIHLLDTTYREITNKRDTGANRKLNKWIHEFLFEEGNLPAFLLSADEDSITRLFSLTQDVKDLDASIKIHMKHKIKERFPDFRFLGEQEVEKVNLGLLVTHASYEAKQRELKHMIDVDIPENSREIGIAMSKGDLRENAEYKAALEKQELLKVAASKLKDELQQAQIFNENDVKTDKIGFGTRARLLNSTNGQREVYSILGPWESNPAKNVLSYLSPLGMALWDRRKGEEVRFTINQNEIRYVVEEVEKAELGAP